MSEGLSWERMREICRMNGWFRYNIVDGPLSGKLVWIDGDGAPVEVTTADMAAVGLPARVGSWAPDLVPSWTMQEGLDRVVGQHIAARCGDPLARACLPEELT
jgi:hypothetical protein